MSQLSEFNQSAVNIARSVQSGDLSPDDIASFYQHRVGGIGKELNIFLDFDQAGLHLQVDELKKKLSLGRVLPLAGVPVAVKDNICVMGMRNTCGSKILEHFTPVYDATVIHRLKEAGALIFGKTNCDEFAMGSSNENSSFGPVCNPWDRSRIPGGSSGGSAAAVAADCVPVSLGSDTGGSIRQPASHCGVVGLKPTYGRVSRYGLVAFGSSLDQIGPFARTVADASLVYDVMSGHDERDSTSLVLPADQTFKEIGKSPKDLRGMKIGIVKEFFGDGIDGPVKSIISQSVEQLKSLGADLVEVSLPYLEYSVPTYYVLATAEASANLARFDGVRYGFRAQGVFDHLRTMYEQTRSQGFGREVKQRVMLGTFALSSGYYDAYYGSAIKARKLIAHDFAKAFESVDLLVSPVSPCPAFKLGEKASDPLALYLSDICTIGVNLAGLPAIAIPAGFTDSGLPVGLQMIAPWQQERTMFKGASAYEHATNWWQHHRPKLS
jgi:aspartyl-tRNA(Asn)/glutamyl-tRNA(Gln) amidotransferase subunit A